MKIKAVVICIPGNKTVEELEAIYAAVKEALIGMPGKLSIENAGTAKQCATARGHQFMGSSGIEIDPALVTRWLNRGIEVTFEDVDADPDEPIFTTKEIFMALDQLGLLPVGSLFIPRLSQGEMRYMVTNSTSSLTQAEGEAWQRGYIQLVVT